MKTIIIGGGIAGLSTAIALQQIGIEIEIYEQAAAPRVAGAGLTLWPNAVHALRELHIEPDDHALPFHAGLHQSNGKPLSKVDAAMIHTRYGTATYAIHREDFMHALMQSAGDVIHYDKRLQHYEQTDTQICATFTDGTTTEADLLIGADGIHSVVRGQMHPLAKPVYRGYAAWRGVTSFTHQYNLWGETWGRGARFGMIPLTNGRVYWFAVSNRAEKSPPPQHKQALNDLFGNWHVPIPELINATPDEMILYNDIADIEPLPTWSDGRALLLGDAAHAMTPNMGQGACQAIEDAVFVARALQTHPSLSDAIQSFEAIRGPQTRKVVLRSRAIGRIGQLSNPVLTGLRDTMTSLTPARVTLRGLDDIMIR